MNTDLPRLTAGSMPRYTERELLLKLNEEFRKGAEACEKLAWHNQRGHIYNSLRASLNQIEERSRDLHYYRQDSRWLTIALYCGEVLKRSGNWLRGAISRQQRAKAHPAFQKLAENMRAGLAACERLETMRTGKIGMILPDPLPGPHRDTRPIQVLRPSGLIVPKEYANG